MVNKSLIRPYFWGGGTLRGVARIPLMLVLLVSGIASDDKLYHLIFFQDFPDVLQASPEETSMVRIFSYIYPKHQPYVDKPRTQMTLVLPEKGLVLEG